MFPGTSGTVLCRVQFALPHPVLKFTEPQGIIMTQPLQIWFGIFLKEFPEPIIPHFEVIAKLSPIGLKFVDLLF